MTKGRTLGCGRAKNKGLMRATEADDLSLLFAPAEPSMTDPSADGENLYKSIVIDPIPG